MVSKKNIPKKLFLEVSKLLFFGIKIKKTAKQQIFLEKSYKILIINKSPVKIKKFNNFFFYFSSRFRYWSYIFNDFGTDMVYQM